MTHFANPFALPGQWFKGNLHTHSTTSDGQLTPDEVVDWYRSRGYHFLALTDHRIPSEARPVAEDFIMLSGIELDGIDPTVGLFHVIGVGFERTPDLSFYEDNPSWLETTVDMQEMINNLQAAGAIVFLAHPYWSGEMSKNLLDMEGCFGLEVWNGACEVWDCKGLSAVHWDDLLAAGRRLWGLGTDDCHWWPGRADAGARQGHERRRRRADRGVRVIEHGGGGGIGPGSRLSGPARGRAQADAAAWHHRRSGPAHRRLRPGTGRPGIYDYGRHGGRGSEN